jgi:hypothetical protein
MVLQLLGFALTIWGINSTFLDLGLGSIPRRAISYLRRFPILPISRIIHGTAKLGTGSATLTGRGISIAPGGSSLEERVENLEKQQTELRQEMKAHFYEFREGSAKLEETLGKAAQDLDRKISDLRERYDAIFRGSAALEIFGIILFTLGVALATASPEISNYLSAKICAAKS